MLLNAVKNKKNVILMAAAPSAQDKLITGTKHILLLI